MAAHRPRRTPHRHTAPPLIEPLEPRLLMADGSVYRLAAATPVASIPNFTTPGTGAGIVLQLGRLASGSTDYLRVTFGDEATGIQLGTIALSSTSTTPQTVYIPLPDAARGRISTLRFALVSGSPSPTAVAEVSAIDVSADLVGMNKDRLNALSQGLTAFNALADDLGRLPALGQALPLKGATGAAVSVGDLATVPDALKTVVGRAVQQYLASTPTPTTVGLGAYLKTLAPAGYAIAINALSTASTEREVRVNLRFTATRTTANLVPDLGAPAADQGFSLAPTTKLSATASVTADLAFGVKIAGGAALPGSFFLRLNSLGVNVAVNGTGLASAARVGMLTASVSGGQFTVAANLAGTAPAGLAGADLSLAQLQSLSAAEILSVAPTGSYKIDLPVAASIATSTAALSARYTLAQSALFSAAAPANTSTGFAALTKFGSLSTADLAEMFGKIRSWLGDLGGSALMATSAPFVQGLDLGTGLDFSSAFATQVLAKIVDAAGAAKFDSVQALVSALGAGSRATYNATTGVLTIPISFSQTMPTLSGRKIDLDVPLGELANARASASTVSVVPTLSGAFTLGIDFTPLGTGVTINASTALSALNGGKGIAPAGDAMAIEVQLADGTRLTISLAGAATLGDVAAKISAASAAKLKAAVDATGKRLTLTDLTTGGGIFAARKSGSSLAAIGLGLAGQDPEMQGTARVLNGGPLHGDSIAQHIFVLPDSTSSPAKLTGTLTATATGIAATASLGLVGLTIANGTATATASLSLPVKDGAKADGRVTVPELLDALASAAATATLAGSAKLNLPLAVQPSGFLPNVSGAALAVDWTDPSLFLADGKNSAGQPLSTNAKAVLTYNAAASRIKTLAGLSYASIESGLQALGGYFKGPGSLRALASQLPLINANFGDILGLGARFDAFVQNLRAAAPTSLADLASKVQAAFATAGATVKLSWDDSATAPALKFSFVFATTATDSRPINVSLTGGRTLVDAAGSSKLSVTATATATVDFGLDLTTPASPKPFLYDTTKLTLTAAVRSSAIDFAATVGSIGVFVHDSTTRGAAAAVFDADGLPGGSPASYTISFPKATTGRYYFGSTLVSSSVEALTGVAKANLPVFFPTRTNELSGPIELTYNLATGATTIKTPFDSGMPTVDLGLDLSGLTGAFNDGMTKLKANLVQQLALFKIPLIGGRVTDSLSFIDQFRDAVLAQIRARGSAQLDLNAMKAAITAAIGPAGLNWGSSALTSAGLLADGGVEFKLSLRRALTAQSGTLDFDLGMPGLGLNLNNARLNFSAAFDFALGFGLSKAGGFYIIADPAADELKVTASAEATTFSALGSLGFFQVKASKPSSQAIRAGATFVVNLKDPSGSDNRVTLADLAGAGYARLFGVGFGKDALGRDSGVDVNLDVQAGFANPSLPALKTGLHVNWLFAAPGTGANPLTGAPTIKYDNVSVQLGEVFRNTIGPVLDNIAKTLAPVKPVIDMLTARLPVISDLAGQNVSLADLAALFGRGDIARYVYATKRVSDLAALISSVASTNAINLGGFDFSLSTSAPSLSGVAIGNVFAPPKSPADQASGNQKQFFTGSSDNAGLAFPLLENPATIFNLLLGRDVDLVQFVMPALNVDFYYKQFFPIIGPLGAQITGRVGATAQFGFGLDTYPLTHGGGLMEGFYVKDLDSNGNDVPEVQFYAQLTAGVELNVGVASAGVEGGIFATIDFNLHDQNGDGKVRLSELQESISLAPIFVFDVSGKLEAGLDAYAEIDLLFWSKRWQYDIARVKLLDFDLKRPTSATIVFDPGQADANGRLNLFTTDEDDTYRILPGSKAGEVVIQTRGMLYTRSGVKTLAFDGKKGNDTVYVDPAVQLLAGGTISLSGGDGNDSLTAGGAWPATLLGGAGNDQLSAGTGPAYIDGGTDHDVLIGGPGNDTLLGNTGNDVLEGGGGADRLEGGDGNDSLFGGDGNDTLVGGIGDDSLSGDGNNDSLTGDGNDSLDGGDGDDTLTGGKVLSGGAGKDVLSGGTMLDGGDGDDVLTGSATASSTLVGGAGNDRITAGSGNDLIWGDDTVAGPAGNDTILAGGGNDVIVGGGGANSIDAGDGNDLVYAGQKLADDPSAIPANTIVGGTGNDTIYGGAGADRIDAGIGLDYVRANGGNDTVLGGDGNDTILGGDGDDSIDGGNNDDSIDGGDGLDRIFAGLGNDVVDGGRGNDLIIGGPDSGSPDADTLVGGAGADTIYGGAGNDVIVGDAGAPYLGAGGTASGVDAYGGDLISGGAGFDAIYGQGGNDTLYGNDGLDEIYGGIGNDLLYGGRDSDLLEGGDGADKLYGGTGADVLKLDTDASYLTSGDTFEGYGGNGMILDAAGVPRADVAQDDRLTATDILLIAGTAGNDAIQVRSKAGDAKVLEAVFNGSRVISALWKDAAGVPQVRQIQVTGLEGNDSIDLSGLDVTGLAVAGGNQFVTGLFGGPGNDTLTGTKGRDQIFGQGGSDSIYGGDGDDRLWGDELGGGDSPSDVNRLFGGAGNDDLIGGQGVNHLYAWSTNPAASSPYGVRGADGKFENTGLDRMLGGPRDDSFYGAGNVAFMYGNGGYDVIYDQAGAKASAQDTLANPDQWKEQARKNDKVWYLPASDAKDEISVQFNGTEHVIRIQQTNGGASTLWAEYKLSDFNWNGRATSVDQFKIQSVVAPGEYATGAATQGGLYQTAAGWGGSLAGPASNSDYDVILIDAFKGDDVITVDVGVYKAIWVDGGPDNDTITVKSSRAILPDQLEGTYDPRQAGKNDTAATASDLGRIDASVLLKDLTIHNGISIAGTAVKADIDYFKFVLGAAPAAGDAIRVESSVAGMDLAGMVLKLYTSAGQAVGSPTRASSGGVLSLSGLVAGQAYWLRVASNDDRADGRGKATIYSLALTLQGASPYANPLSFSSERAISNSNVLIGGAGNDSITGGLGEDWIFGGSGNDTLSGGDDFMAADLLFGETGSDTFLLAPSTLPDGTDVSTFVGGDMIDGGSDYWYSSIVDTVKFVGSSDRDLVAFGYNDQGLVKYYTMTQYVWDRDAGWWAEDQYGFRIQKYSFFNVARVDGIQFDLGAGDDEFHANPEGYWMEDGASYGFAASPWAPISGVTVNGGAGDDTIVGGDGADALYGDRIDATSSGKGFDSIRGNGGNDTLDGGDYDDTLVGGLGSDVLYGRSGNDELVGDEGNAGSGDPDTLYGGDGADSLYGNGGADYLYGENQGDDIYGNYGDDVIDAGEGNDTVRGGEGSDSIRGGVGNDDLYGDNGGAEYSTDGDDTILGESGFDTLRGLGGNDSLIGGADDDTVYGGGGNDRMWGSEGDDRLEGGGGSDFMVGDLGGQEYATDGKDTMLGQDGDDTLYGFGGKDLVYGGNGSDSIDGGGGDDDLYGDTGGQEYATDGNDTIWGGAGRDTLRGLGGNDSLIGGADDDSVYGGGGNDRMWGSEGSDYLDGGANEDLIMGDNGGSYLSTDGNDTIRGGLGSDSLYGGGGNDSLIGDIGTDGDGSRDEIYGEEGNDSLYGNGGDDYLNGGSEADELYGNGGNDYLVGGPNPDGDFFLVPPDGPNSMYGNDGNDTIYGGWAGDYINGGANNDYLVGGTHNDTINGGSGNDSIWGESGDDRIYSNDNEADTIAGGPGYDIAWYDQEFDSRGNTIEQLNNALTAASAGPGSSPLRADAIPPLLAEAIGRWRAAGAGADLIRAMRGATVRVERLPEGLLAYTDGGVIVVDADAAGNGWFVDATPGEDSEFAAGPSNGPAAGRIDLLTVLAHELGHVAGLGHGEDSGDAMHWDLPAGVRRLPEAPIDASRPSDSAPGPDWAMITPPPVVPRGVARTAFRARPTVEAPLATARAAVRTIKIAAGGPPLDEDAGREIVADLVAHDLALERAGASPFKPSRRARS
ncbi:Bifunctional hemolysin/adenylate cyclase precursor [Aquisphaera giovannonii]|uniref:Bifunctional hemolysin/adenylate cyclase n=1 Tax=Aquisphaera giovannonii TaxID=406548 RepID=A0A5B9W5L2_9BACT|nr:hypothetical protein [Aquisphaera giovannonii]QEH35607.1 Bifunctional hemolysin/adenylate cyclase precursor [Aquisphaera giovannonii]